MMQYVLDGDQEVKDLQRTYKQVEKDRGGGDVTTPMVMEKKPDGVIEGLTEVTQQGVGGYSLVNRCLVSLNRENVTFTLV